MSRATADRGCIDCGWQGTHIPEDEPYICPRCGKDISGKPVPYDVEAYLKKKAESVARDSQPPVVRQ